MSAAEEIVQIEKVLKNMARLVKQRAKRHNVALVYGVNGEIISKKFSNLAVKK